MRRKTAKETAGGGKTRRTATGVLGQERGGRRGSQSDTVERGGGGGKKDTSRLTLIGWGSVALESWGGRCLGGGSPGASPGGLP